MADDATANPQKEWAEFEAKTEIEVRNDLAMNRYGEFKRAHAQNWLAHKSAERISASNSQQAAAAARAAAAAERAAAAAEEQATQAQRANRIATTALVAAIAAVIMSLIALARKIS